MRDGRPQGLLVLPFLALLGIGAADGPSPIVEAAKNRDRAAIQAQLATGADINAPALDGTTALHWAAHWDDLETAASLIRAGANVNAANRYGATPLWMACSNGNLAVVTALLKAGANPNQAALEGEPPLMTGARSGNVEVVKALLARGADANVRDNWKSQTALMWAVGDHDPHPDIARVLVEAHADVNARSKGGFTPLLFAVRQGSLESVRILAEAGADVNDKVPGISLLLVAINNREYGIADYLLQKGANPKGLDRDGFTPLHNVVRKRASDGNEAALALMKALVARGADVNARTPAVPLKWPPTTEPSPRPKVDEIEFGGATPFWIAANAADAEALRLLVSLGADTTVTTIEHTTALMAAAGLGFGTRGPTARLGGRLGCDPPCMNTGALEVVKLLAELGNDIRAVNDNGQTALHAAASAALPEVAKFLLDQGVRTDLKDTLGRTPLQVAEDNRTDKYRSNQNLPPALIERTWDLLRSASARNDQERPH